MSTIAIDNITAALAVLVDTDPACADRQQLGELMGLARKVRDGSDVCLIGVGKMLAAATEAAGRLEEAGVSTTVWDPRVVKPLDPEMLADAADHRLVVTIEDGLRDGGAGSAIADALSKLAPGGPQVRVLGVPSAYLAHGKPDAILSRLGLDADGIVDEVLSGTGAVADQSR